MKCEREECPHAGDEGFVPSCSLAECPGKRTLLERGLIRYRCRGKTCKHVEHCIEHDRCMYNLKEEAA